MTTRRARTPRPKLPLAGVTVLDFSRVLAGPLCTQTLGDLGARVIKIEEPGRGDETRRWGPPFAGDVSSYFLAVNRNKESVTLNLRSEEGLRIAAKLIETADVVIDNFLPRQRRSFGLDRAARHAVHCSITGFDPDSPDADIPGYDLLAQAGGGLMAITGEADGEPMRAGVALADVLTGHYATSAILAALFGRERSRRGVRLEISLFSATVSSLVNIAQNALVTGKEAKRHGNAHASIVPYQLFRGSDRTFVVGAGTDKHFQLLCRDVLSMPALAEEERFVTNSRRVEHRAELIPILEDVFARRKAAEWVARCRDAGVPAALVQGVREALDTPSGQLITDQIEHPDGGTYHALMNPLMIAGRRLGFRRRAPRLGEHTARVLREIGIGAKDVTRLRREGVI